MLLLYCVSIGAFLETAKMFVFLFVCFLISRRNTTYWPKVGKMGVGKIGVGQAGNIPFCILIEPKILREELCYYAA